MRQETWWWPHCSSALLTDRCPANAPPCHRPWWCVAWTVPLKASSAWLPLFAVITPTTFEWVNTCLCCCCCCVCVSFFTVTFGFTFSASQWIFFNRNCASESDAYSGSGGIQHHFWTEVSQSIHVNCEPLCLAQVIFWSILMNVNQPEMFASTNYNVKFLQMSQSGSPDFVPVYTLCLSTVV